MIDSRHFAADAERQYRGGDDFADAHENAGGAPTLDLRCRIG
jgi:hypothetical protein